MESFNARRLYAFVHFMSEADPQILANRREGRALYQAARQDDGEFLFSADKADKMETFLSLNDQQVHQAGHDNTVSIYSFVKILSDMRRRVKAHMKGEAASGSTESDSTPKSGAAASGPSFLASHDVGKKEPAANPAAY